MPMPETEIIELRTDTVEQLIELLGNTYAEDIGEIMPRDRRRAVADRLRRETTSQDAVALAGLPGAGKSFTAEKLADVYDAEVVSMGDAIREEAPDYISSEELGDYAAEWREEASEEIPEKVVEIAKEKGKLVIIDGVRSITDYDVLSSHFDNFHLIEVEAKFYERLSRIQERDREGEGDFSAIDLADRDENERYNLGFGDLEDSGHIDLSVKNGTGPDALAISLSRVVENNLPYDIENGKPLGLDDELEQVRKNLKAKTDGGPVGE